MPTPLQSKEIFIGGGTGSGSGAFTSACTNGSTIVVTVFDGGGVSQTVTVSDPTNGTYASALSMNLATDHDTIIARYHANTATTALTISVTCTNLLAFIIEEFPGIYIAGSPIDQTHSANSSSNSPNSGAAATSTNAQDMLFGFVGTSNGGNAATAGSGYTLSGNAPNAHLWTEWEDVSATGAYAANFGLLGTDEWACGIVVFKRVLGAAAPTPRMGLLGVG